MKRHISLDAVYEPSDDVIIREAGKELVIIPFSASVEDADHEPYLLNRTGRAIWQELGGSRSLRNIASELAVRFEIPVEVIEKDILEFVDKLLKAKLLVEVSGS